MRATRRAVLALLAVAAGWSAAATAAVLDDGTLLVVNRNGGSIVFFDLPTRTEIARLPIGPVIPHEVAVSPDGRLGLTSEYGPDDQRGRHLVVFDIVNPKIITRIDLGERTRPHSMRFMPDGRRAVVTLQDSDQIALVDLATGRVVRRYPTGGREGHMVRLSPDGTRAYVTSRGAEGTLSVIFLDAEKPPVVIKTGGGSEGIAVSPDGGEIWAVNRTAESISVVDAEKLAVVATVPAKLYAGRAEISAAGRVAVPNGGGGNAVPQYLTVYDQASRAITAELPVREGEASRGSFGVLIQGETLFVGDRAGARILIYDLDTLADPQVLPAPGQDPDGLAWSPLRVGVFSQ
jgi:YVTN family beta-propeller protein